MSTQHFQTPEAALMDRPRTTLSVFELRLNARYSIAGVVTVSNTQPSTSWSGEAATETGTGCTLPSVRMADSQLSHFRSRSRRIGLNTTRTSWLKAVNTPTTSQCSKRSRWTCLTGLDSQSPKGTYAAFAMASPASVASQQWSSLVMSRPTACQKQNGGNYETKLKNRLPNWPGAAVKINPKGVAQIYSVALDGLRSIAVRVADGMAADQ